MIKFPMKMLIYYYLMCSSLIQLINSASLMHLPLKLTTGVNVILHATLTDTLTGKTWFIREYLSTSDPIKGKINVEYDSKSFDIYYGKTNDYQRLVIHDNQCDLFTFNGKEHWDLMLPEVTSSLTNTILLVGPSLIYRIGNDLNAFRKGASSMVKGVQMDSISREISTKLKVIIYHQRDLDIESALIEPQRIQFDGYNLVLDITLHTITDDQLDKETQVIPGIGCSVELETNKPFPKLSTQQIHMIISEKVINLNSQSISTSQIYADNEKQLLTIKVDDGLVKIFDYNQGLVYNYGGDNLNCQLKQIDYNGPGLIVSDYKSARFDLYQLLEMRRPLRYLGQVDYQFRSSFTIDGWESVEYKVTFNQVYYDKLVVTIYMGKTTQLTGFTNYNEQNYLPLVIVINGYNNTKDGYYSTLTIEREIYDYRNYFTESEVKSLIQSTNCLTVVKKIQLTFKLNYQDIDKQIVEDNLELIKSSLVNEIIKNGNISPLRIENIDLQLNSLNQLIVASVILLEAPSVEDIFTTQLRRLDVSKIRPSSGIHVETIEKCLQVQTSFDETIRAVVYCSEEEIVCSSIFQEDELIDDLYNGHLCVVIESQLAKLHQVGQQIKLDSLHDYLLESTANSILRIPIDSNDSLVNGQYFNLLIMDIVDSSPSTLTNHPDQQFNLIGPIKGFTLKDEHIDLPLPMTIGYFGDCYRSCGQLDCNSFSYCQVDNRPICKMSSQLITTESKLIIASNESCNTYHKNVELTKFHQIKSRQFKETNSNPVKVIKSSDCASLCLNESVNCYSYQFCQSTQLCYFADYYSQQLTSTSQQCDIFIPSKLTNYHLTGSNIIVNTNHIELNLNIDQCASLCSGMDTDQCKSFNYCPKSRSGSSLCSLSNWTINDQLNVQLTESTSCRNYELIEKPKIVSSEQQSTKYSLIGQLTQIKLDLTLIYILTGLLFGFLTTLIVTKSIQLVGQSKRKIVDHNLSQEQQFDDIFGL